MKNGCPKCEKLPPDELCLDCQIEQADWEVLSAMNKLERLQRIKERNANITSKTANGS